MLRTVSRNGGKLLAGAVGISLVFVSRALTRRRFEREHAIRFARSTKGIVSGAEPIAFDASRSHAALLLHGFNDTPQSMEYLAASLYAEGWSVCVPLLPGHGRSLEAMTKGRASDWLSHAQNALTELQRTHSSVVVCGQSMGAAIAVLLASSTAGRSRRSDAGIKALVLLSPFIGVPRALTAKFAAAWVPQLFFPYRTSTGGERSIHDPAARVQALSSGVVTARLLEELRKISIAAQAALETVHVATLYLQSLEDNRVKVIDARRNFSRLGEGEHEQQWIEGCGHIISADFCREEVAQQTRDWFEKWAGTPMPLD